MFELKYNKPNTEKLDLEIDQQYLKDIVAKLAFPRPINTPENTLAMEIVSHEMSSIFGMNYVLQTTNNLLCGNTEQPRILIGAHYDSVPGSPGADDNASAIAVMLAAARILKDQKDIAFIAFNGEECGLAGSKEFVDDVWMFNLDKLEQTHILEMVGYRNKSPNSQMNPIPVIDNVPTVGDFLGIVSNTPLLSDWVINRASCVGIPVVGLSIPMFPITAPMLTLEMIEEYCPHILRSDHASFWRKSLPATMWTDTSEFRNQNYHKATDTPDTLDYEFMAEVAKLLVSVCKG